MALTKDKPKTQAKRIRTEEIEIAADHLASLEPTLDKQQQSEITYRKRLLIAEAAKRGRLAQFWTPQGLERLSRLIIGAITPERDQQMLAAQAAVCPSTVGNLRKNFGNSATGVIGRNIDPKLPLDVAPFVPSEDEPTNGWLLVFMGCGFLDGRDPAELYAAIDLLKAEIERQKRSERSARRRNNKNLSKSLP